MNKDYNCLKIEVIDTTDAIAYDVSKANCLLNKVVRYFDSCAPEAPSQEEVNAIEHNYNDIRVMLDLIGDVLTMIDTKSHTMQAVAAE